MCVYKVTIKLFALAVQLIILDLSEKHCFGQVRMLYKAFICFPTTQINLLLAGMGLKVGWITMTSIYTVTTTHFMTTGGWGQKKIIALSLTCYQEHAIN